MVIAIDGPAGAGKGTVASKLSKKLGFLNLDTGMTYRCLAFKCISLGVSKDEEEKIIELSKKLNISEKDKKVYLDGEDVTKKIRSHEVSMFTSEISKILDVRKNLVKLQRHIADGKDVVAEGRDITTVVFPNAEYKFYIDASIDERTKRRFKEDESIPFEELKKQIEARDYNDENKEFGALKRTSDQIYIDTTNMTIDEVVNKMLEVIK